MLRSVCVSILLVALTACATPVRLGPDSDPKVARELLSLAAVGGPVRMEINGLVRASDSTLLQPRLAQQAARGVPNLNVRFTEAPGAPGSAMLLLLFDPPADLQLKLYVLRPRCRPRCRVPSRCGWWPSSATAVPSSPMLRDRPAGRRQPMSTGWSGGRSVRCSPTTIPRPTASGTSSDSSRAEAEALRPGTLSPRPLAYRRYVPIDFRQATGYNRQ